MNVDQRRLMLNIGYVLVFASAITLVGMLLPPGEAFDKDDLPTQVGDDRAASDEKRRIKRRTVQERFDKFWGRYYAVVAIGIFGVWIICTSTGGFILSPMGLVLSGVFLLGQVRANHEHDILILFVAALVAILSSDLIVHQGWMNSLFASAEDWSGRGGVQQQSQAPAMSATSWYLAIIASVTVSTWVNWKTFEGRPRSAPATPAGTTTTPAGVREAP